MSDVNRNEEGMGMKLTDLLEYDSIVVQCHDNPDADAIASGYAVYRYLKANNKKVRLVYGGRNAIQKSNLVLMLEYLELTDVIEHITDMSREYADGLVLTVDCQYGAGNVSSMPAKDMAIIDHHQVEIKNIAKSKIVPELGSCSTLIWKMMKDEGIEISDIKLSTALYYGLYTDTNALSEIYNPFDKDMRDIIPYEKTVIYILKNSNFSLNELEIAGNAMKGYSYYADNKFAVIRTEQCDPNMLGLISDFLLQVAEIDICVVYNEWPNGYKFSVRSCIKEVHANELAAFVAEKIGSGGGHLEKAGGFVQKTLFAECYGDITAEEFFRRRINAYFVASQIIYPAQYEVDLSSMKEYVKKPVYVGYVNMTDVYEVGTPITVRTLEGDFDIVVEEDLIVMIGIKGEVYPSRRDKFNNKYEVTNTRYTEDERISKPEYLPTVHNRLDGSVTELTKYAYVCQGAGGAHIYAKQSDKILKIFTEWDKEKYMAGKIGDYLAVRADDLHDLYVVEREIFGLTYEEVQG